MHFDARDLRIRQQRRAERGREFAITADGALAKQHTGIGFEAYQLLAGKSPRGPAFARLNTAQRFQMQAVLRCALLDLLQKRVTRQTDVRHASARKDGCARLLLQFVPKLLRAQSEWNVRCALSVRVTDQT